MIAPTVAVSTDFKEGRHAPGSPGGRKPMFLPTHPPTTAPRTPSPMVTRQAPFSSPGITRRAIAPANNPRSTIR
jgi:hypothetical protein